MKVCKTLIIEISKLPLFVTWNIDKYGNGDKELRGCIGTFSPIPLVKGLNEYALTSAFKDTRFKPIPEKDLPKLHCAISLLVNFEQAKDCWDWEVGKHGILIDFKDSRNQSHRGTYLPEVMPEQEWSQREALESLIKKAGYYGKVDDHLFQSIKLTRYQSSKISLSYNQYLQFKEQQNKQQ
ncbi:DUF51 family protein [Heterostelium album PN500]|uniref:DUF51 family protein n=1 Tax=Heterostelium pallidum (strain ATCC 26659 / Pp 5 / PN500) TaxID=670386 RepID=D3B2R4_HETP5|nr:DUF51 family protein [Heterostelium album PN500]EFA83612.1 DUF51 family protein [Heterostelium album PN500]|eukprot:XP_020435729.1 DUF51 family protein [Heterostelium album PN500]